MADFFDQLGTEDAHDDVAGAGARTGARSKDRAGAGAEYDEDEASGNTRSSPSGPGSTDLEYYTCLNLPKTATEQEIRAAYRNMSKHYHPDKHQGDPELIKQADKLFKKIKTAYEVLIDPHRRTIYDVLGKKGLEENNWPIDSRGKSTQDIRKEYERIVRERAEALRLRRTNPRAKFVCELDATDMFERYLYAEELDEYMDQSIPKVEVSKIDLGVTTDFSLTDFDTITLAGNAASGNGHGEGSITARWKRVTTGNYTYRADVGCGSGLMLRGTCMRQIKLTQNNHGYISGSMQLVQGGFVPGIDFSIGNNFSEKTAGSLNFSSKFTLTETEDEYLLLMPTSGMSTSIAHSTENYQFLASLHFGIPHSLLDLTAVRKFAEPDSKANVRLRIGTAGSVLEYGVQKRITEDSVIGASVAIGIPNGVSLKIKLLRNRQTFLFPVHFSDDILMQPIFYATVCPLLAYFVTKKLVLDPIEAKKKAEEREHFAEAERQRILEAKNDAEYSISLMKERYNRIVANETQKHGLVIIVALFGKLLSDSEELLHPVEEFLSDDEELKFRVSTNQSQVINVTVAMQCFLDGSSKIRLFEGRKSELNGFFDPCPMEEERYLLVRYRYQGSLHQVIVKEHEAMKIPKTQHRINEP